MRIKVNDTEVTFPSSLSEFTLGQRIDFHTQYGRELDEMAKAVAALPEGPERELETTHYQFEKMFATFAFFTGISVDAIKESEFIDQVAQIYFSCLEQLFAEEAAIELQQEFVWKGEMWYLQPPVLVQGSPMTFGELIDSKQVVKNMIELGAGRWEFMLPLAAVYLRRQGEAYDKAFLYEGSERQRLMRDLPMDIALQVGFFLSASMNTYVNFSRSSGLVEAKAEDVTALSTSTVGAGSTS